MKKINLQMKSGFDVKQTEKNSQVATMVLKSGETTGGPDNKHEGIDQWMYIMSGKGEAIINGEKVTFNKGDLILIEAGDYHEIKNTDHNDLQTLNFYSPPAY